jgi:hypothetical protein
MKKFIILIGILFALQTVLMAQSPTGNVVFNAHLHGTLNLNILAGGTPQLIDFVTAANYNLGVTGPTVNGINPGSTMITVEATQNWNLNISCTNFTGAGGTIPIDNLGVYCAATEPGIWVLLWTMHLL